MHSVSKAKLTTKQTNKFKSKSKRHITSLNKRKLSSTKHPKLSLDLDQFNTNSSQQLSSTLKLNTLIQSHSRLFSTTSNDASYNVHAHRSPLTPEEKERLAISQKHTQEQEIKNRQSMFEHFGKPKPPNPYDIQIDPKTNMPYDPYSDPKNELYIPGPKIDDDSNPYSIATRQDNEEYVRQITVLNNFQEGMKELTGFIDPFYDQNKMKEQLPTTRGEMNSMLQHAILQEHNYELGWERFSKMINAVPDYLKSYLSSPLFDQFNSPILFKRDTDVGANEEKVIFQPDMRSYQLITVACLQAFEQFKTTYHPKMLQAAIQIARSNNFTNSQNDDRLESEAAVMLNQLNEIETEIQRRLTLPIEEQERLLSLENGGLGHIGGINDVNEVSNNMGLHKAISLIKSNDLFESNKLVYDEKLGITEHHRQFQQREKLLGTGQTIVEIVDDPTQINSNPLKYKANRRVLADSDDEIDTNNNEQSTTLNDEKNTNNNNPTKPKSTPQFGHAILTGDKTADGFDYKISLPQLPYSLDYGEELDEWKTKLTEIATIALQTSQELQEVREIMTQDPFSPEYHCLQQVSTWNARLNFVLRDIIEHYYGLLWNRSPQLYQLLRSTTYPPPPNYSGVDALNDAIGQNTELLDTVINAAKDQKLHHLWLEAVTLKSKFTPAPIHVLTIPERQMMIRENYLKEMIFTEILNQIPTADYKDDLIKTNISQENVQQEQEQQQQLVPNLTPQQFVRCLKLFLDFDQQVQSYIKAVKNYDNNFLADIDIKRKTESLINNTPQKLKASMHPEELAAYTKEQDDLKQRDELHRKIQEKNGGFKDFETKSYQFKQTQLSDLTPEQINEYRLRRPQPLPEMLTMDRMIGETIRRYPLLASLAPRDCSHYIPIETIIEKRYGTQSQLPGLLKTIDFKSYGGIPLNPTKINITQFGFDSIDKVLAFPYPQTIQEQINSIKVTMTKVPILNSILIPPNEVEVQSSRHNYKHLLLSPSTSLMTMTDAIDFINKFTGMAKLIQTQEIELGRVEEIQEYSYQIDYQSFLQSKYQKMVQIHQIMDNSLCIRNMSRLGMYYIDTMIISWAAQQGKKLPPQYCQLVTESYTTLTNDIFQQEIGSHTLADNDNNNNTNNNNVSSREKSQQELESKSLQHDLSLVNPRLTRIQQWKLRNLNDELTNPTKFYALPVDERVELIDKKHQEAKETNTFAQFFLQKLDDNLPPDDPLQPYHLLRSYLRFAIRAGDAASLEKALYVYRQTTRLVEYVQRRTNEDVYVDGADSMFANVTTEEEFNKAVEQQELLKKRNEEIDAEIPAAIRNDMTRDDIQKSTTNIGPKSKLFDKWYGTTSIKPPSDNKDIHDAFTNDPRGQPEAHNQAEQREMDQLVNESGMLDDYADRIDALLSAKHTQKKASTTKLDGVDENDGKDDGDIHSVLSQELGDEKHIEMYKNMVKKQKSTKLGDLFVPGFDMSEEENSSDQDELDGQSKSSTTNPERKMPKMKSSITPDGRMENEYEINDEAKKAEMEKKKVKHAPHTRLSKLANAPHIPFDYMLTHMVINFHQLLIRNGSHAYRIGLPNDVVSKRFSDEVSAHWALARRQLYDNRIALVHSFDAKINNETGIEYSASEYRERQKEKAKIAIKMLKRNRNENDLNEFEKDAAQIAIMTLDTLILENFIPVAKIIAKQAYDDGLLTKDFIETFFEKNGPDLDANPSEVVSKELGLEQLMKQQ